MSLKSSLTPRAPSQRETPRKKPSKVWTIRALERDRVRALPAPVRPPEPAPVIKAEPETTDRAFWRRLPLLSRGPMVNKS